MNSASAPPVRSIDHVHVYVSDRAAAELWYGKVLGFTRTTKLESWAEGAGPLTIQNAEATVHLALFERPAQKCRSTIALAVGAREFVAWKRHLSRALGREPEFEDHDLSVSLYFEDPYGNPYEITTYEHESARLGLK